jgi:hypothetical protein
MDEECCSLPHLLNAINSGYEMLINMSYKRWEHNPYEHTYTPALSKGWETYYDRADNIWREEYYHNGTGYKFAKEDEYYIEQSINIGECPLCNSNELETLANGEIKCNSCESGYFIPINKYSEIMEYNETTVI